MISIDFWDENRSVDLNCFKSIGLGTETVRVQRSRVGNSLEKDN